MPEDLISCMDVALYCILPLSLEADLRSRKFDTPGDDVY